MPLLDRALATAGTSSGAIPSCRYTRLGMTADEVGRRLGTSRSVVLRSAHTFGVPVRAGGAEPILAQEEIELVNALYVDPLIAAVLDARGIPRIPPGAPIWERFPVPRIHAPWRHPVAPSRLTDPFPSPLAGIQADQRDLPGQACGRRPQAAQAILTAAAPANRGRPEIEQE